MSPARTSSTSWYLDEDTAADACRFFEAVLVHVKGHLARQPFRLLPFQRHHVSQIFGRLRKEDRLRITRTVWWEMGAKQGKSPIGSGLALHGLFADAEAGAEVFSVANSKGQAAIVFNVAADMVEASPLLSRRAKVFRSRVAWNGVIYVPKTESVYRVISADVGVQDGINASRVIFDEPHRARSRELWDLMQKSGIARQEPLLIGITTAGLDDPTLLARQEHDYAIQVDSGVVDDPTYYPALYYNPPDADWRLEETWRRANPALGTRAQVLAGDAILAIEDFQARMPKLEQSPAELVTFKRLNLGMWLPASAGSPNKLIDLGVWDRSAGIVDEKKLKGRDCYGGLDNASTTDLAAFLLVFRNEPGICKNCKKPKKGEEAKPCLDVVGRFWIPEANLADGYDGWPAHLKESMRQWVSSGHVIATPGQIIDDRFIEAEIDRLRRTFTVVEVAKDPFQSKQLGVLLEEAGLEVYDIRQTVLELADPTDVLIGLASDRRLHHGGNPVLRWMIDNTVTYIDPDGKKKPDRKKSSGKIDGVVALVMAIAAATREQEDMTPVFAWTS